VKRERLDFLAENARYTKRFAYYVGKRCRASTIQDIAEELGLEWHTVKELEKQYMHEQLRRAETPGPKVIGIDELSIRKRHTYRIVVSDLVRMRPVWFGGNDRSEASMDVFFQWLGPKKTAGIRLAVMDMWKAFRNSTERHAPQAHVLFDKFHVLRHLGTALDTVRKSEYARLSGKDRRFIKGQKYTLLAHRENLTLEGRKSLRLLLAANRRLNTAYLLKESFGQLWDYQREAWARRFFRELARVAQVAAAQALRALRGDDRATLGWDRRLLRVGEQGRPRLRRGTQQQDPRHPTSRLRSTRRGVPAAQSPHHHASPALGRESSENDPHESPKSPNSMGTSDSSSRDACPRAWTA
jgi:transposase